jgi:uncharacterized protein
MKPRRLAPVEALIIGCVITAGACIWFRSAFIVCPGVAFTIMLVMGSGQVLERLQGCIDRRPSRVILAPAVLWILYVVYAAGTGIADLAGAAVMAAYLGMPFLILQPHRRPKLRIWREPAAILWIWLPIEAGLIRRVLITNQDADLHYTLAQLLAIDAGIVAFAVWNRMPNIGYRFEWDRAIVRAGMVNFLAFAVIAIPLGLGIRFITFSLDASELLAAPAAYAGIFLFTALPEEFLFRGVIQNWLERTTGKPAASLVLAAIIFGASHLNNGLPIPNYRYFLLASVAGVFYGMAWRRTGSLMASSATHALVDTTWTMFFR